MGVDWRHGRTQSTFLNEGILMSTPESTIEPRIAAESREQLLYLLAEAAEIEHNLMCCYLYAAFSLKRDPTEGITADEAAAIGRWRRAITEVAVEEMSHLALVANLTTALGGAAHFSRPNFPVSVGHYPSGVVVKLAPFDRQTLQHFLYLERPEGHIVPDGEGFASPQTYNRGTVTAKCMPSAQDYLTVGHLYRALADGLNAAVARQGERAVFIGDPSAQIGQRVATLPGLCEVVDLRSALAALDTIVRQGEGATVAAPESHYGRFGAIAQEYDRLHAQRRDFVPHRPVASSPVMRKPPDPAGKVHIDSPPAAAVLDVANAIYGLMLRALAQAFGRPGAEEAKRLLVDTAIDLMFALSPLADLLTTLPASSSRTGVTAGVSFAMLRDVACVPHGAAEWSLLHERLQELTLSAHRLPQVDSAVIAVASTLDDLARKFSQRVSALDAGGLAGESAPQAPAADAGPAHVPTAGVEVVRGRELTLRFEAKRCIHSRFCVLWQPRVYKANVQGAWIDPDAATVEANVGVAHNCPSGAIHYERHDGGPPEPAPEVNLASVRENGPYAFRAPLSLGGTQIGYRATLCRCGGSQNKPFCDGSHAAVGFTASGEPGTGTFEPLAVRDGPLSIDPRRNGPLAVSGNLEILSGTGRTIMKTTRVTLCRCGHSGNKPYCDGTHARIGFQAG
jgi:CDGSH-type Zn-finger protein/uncharacterized Fe-S cluster protein YjdI